MKTINACAPDSKDCIVITIETCDKKGAKSSADDGAAASSTEPAVSGRKSCGENPENICPKGGRCVKCTKRKRKKGAMESGGDAIKIQKLQLPILNPRLHGPGCAMEVCVLERHEPNCPYKKLENDQRDPLDDRSGSYDCIGRMAFRTCNPEEGLVMEGNRNQASNSNKRAVDNEPKSADPDSISMVNRSNRAGPDDYPETKSDRRDSNADKNYDDLLRDIERNSPKTSPRGSIRGDDYNRESSTKQPYPQASNYSGQDRGQKSPEGSYQEPRGQSSSPRGSLRGDEDRVQSTRRSLREDDERPESSRRSVRRNSETEDQPTRNESYRSAADKTDDQPTRNESYRSAADNTRNDPDKTDEERNSTVMTLLTQPIFYETVRKKRDVTRRRCQHDLNPPACCSRDVDNRNEMIKNLIKSTKVFENFAKVKCDKCNQIPACITKSVDVPSIAQFTNVNPLRNSQETIISLRSDQNSDFDEDDGGKFRLFGFFRKKPKAADDNKDLSDEPQAVLETMKRMRK